MADILAATEVLGAGMIMKAGDLVSAAELWKKVVLIRYGELHRYFINNG